MMDKIIFKRLKKSEYADFAKETKEIFSIAVTEAFGESLENDYNIESSLENPELEVFSVYSGDEKVGGIAVKKEFYCIFCSVISPNWCV